MNTSVLEIFKIGIGPSSSHTMGPMNAAREFAATLRTRDLLPQVRRVQVTLYGSLALTGRGHCTDRALLLGLEGLHPATVDPEAIEPTVARITETRRLKLDGRNDIAFDTATDLVWRGQECLPAHPNGLAFAAFDGAGKQLFGDEIYSVGGGFIARAADLASGGAAADAGRPALPLSFTSGEELLAHCEREGIAIHELVLRNEDALRPRAETRAALLNIWQVMRGCIERGLAIEGVLPGVLKVKRRAPRLYRSLSAAQDPSPIRAMDWVNVWALSVNEENAAGSRVVTAPTNGAAGIVPSVLMYYRTFEPRADDEGTLRFLLAAGAMGMLYKRNASISGAEMGCQGEVGVACSMAAAGLTAALQGSDAQVENAAEIGMEHNLGLTCDPVAGLVQIPCIERNAMGAVKAINASRLALHGDGSHKVSLDQVIETMRQTGLDMKTVYKETSQGGLAVNVPEC